MAAAKSFTDAADELILLADFIQSLFAWRQLPRGQLGWEQSPLDGGTP
jgi:hypothetical protein